MSGTPLIEIPELAAGEFHVMRAAAGRGEPGGPWQLRDLNGRWVDMDLVRTVGDLVADAWNSRRLALAVERGVPDSDPSLPPRLSAGVMAKIRDRIGEILAGSETPLSSPALETEVYNALLLDEDISDDPAIRQNVAQVGDAFIKELRLAAGTRAEMAEQLVVPEWDAVSMADLVEAQAAGRTQRDFVREKVSEYEDGVASLLSSSLPAQLRDEADPRYFATTYYTGRGYTDLNFFLRHGESGGIDLAGQGLANGVLGRYAAEVLAAEGHLPRLSEWEGEERERFNSWLKSADGVSFNEYGEEVELSDALLEWPDPPAYDQEVWLHRVADDLVGTMAPLPEDIVVGRAVDSSRFTDDDMVPDVPSLVGRTLENHGFTSTTLNVDSPPNISGGSEKTYMILNVPAGQDAGWMENWTPRVGEREVLLPPGIEILVTEVREWDWPPYDWIVVGNVVRTSDGEEFVTERGVR